MLFGIGTDIVKNSRFLNKPDSFLEELFNESEMIKIKVQVSQKRKAETAGSLFALKEAVSKSLGFSLFECGIKNIIIINTINGSTKVILSEALREKVLKNFKINDYTIYSSLSHEEDYSVAFATFEGFYEK